LRRLVENPVTITICGPPVELHQRVDERVVIDRHHEVELGRLLPADRPNESVGLAPGPEVVVVDVWVHLFGLGGEVKVCLGASLSSNDPRARTSLKRCAGPFLATSSIKLQRSRRQSRQADSPLYDLVDHKRSTTNDLASSARIQGVGYRELSAFIFGEICKLGRGFSMLANSIERTPFPSAATPSSSLPFCCG
jgi:hypothetical protein